MKTRKHAPPALQGKKRLIAALVGIVLLIPGQVLIARNPPNAAPSTLVGKWLNDVLHLGMVTIDSVLLGVVFVLVGGVLLGFALAGTRCSPANEEYPADKPPAIKFLFRSWPFILAGAAFYAGLLLKLGDLENGPASWLWFASLMIFLFTFGQWDRDRGVRLSPGLTRQDWTWLLVLLIGGFLVVTYRLQSWPDQLMPDEGIFGSTAADIATGIFNPSIFAQGVDTFPILSTFYQSSVMQLFGIDIWGWRFASVLAGVFSVIPLYLLARDAFNKRLAVISCIILLANPYFLVYSRLGYTNIQPVFLLAVTIYLLYTGLRKASYAYIFLAGCCAGFGFYTYFSGRSALIVVILFILLLWLTKRIGFRKSVITAAVFILGTGLVAAPHIVSGIRQNPDSMVFRIFLSLFNNAAYAGTFYPNSELVRFAPMVRLGENELFFNPGISLVLILRGFIQTLLPFQKSGMLWGQHYLASPLAGTLGAFFYVVGLVVALRHIKHSNYQLVLLWFFTIITILSALNTFPPREDHMVPAVPALALLIGFGLEAILGALAPVFNWVTKHSQVVLVLLLFPVVGSGLYDYFVTGPRYFPQGPEDIMSWAGFNSDGETLLYVFDVPLRPDFVPWAMYEFREDVNYEAFQMEEFIANIGSFEGSRKTVVFFPPEIDNTITPVLQAEWGNNLTRKVFLGKNGSPVLVAEMNTPFVFERDRTFLDTLPDAFHHALFSILLAVLVLLLLLVIFVPIPKKRLSNA
jgi:4-amino-4-deoxy-L-arabinose transferase-like glycosyltransferase